MKYPKKQKGYLLFLVSTGIILSSSILFSELHTSSTQEHTAAPSQQQSSNKIEYCATNLCTNMISKQTTTFTTQADTSEANKNDNISRIFYDKSIFTQDELSCRSNS